jgi:hypothetical protein
MKNDHKDKKHKSSTAREQVRQTGGHPDLAPDQGNITEGGDQGLVGTNRRGAPSSSGLTTRKTITGSDFDGQAA